MDRTTEQSSSSRSFSSQSSLIVHAQENNAKELSIDSPENLPGNLHGEDEESTVDLTEPRFESFCVSNISSVS